MVGVSAAAFNLIEPASREAIAQTADSVDRQGRKTAGVSTNQIGAVVCAA
ncbi:hypothetical protein [Mesorhizobium loti]|nr:hypothetical protein [Mesorhizobium loti]